MSQESLPKQLRHLVSAFAPRSTKEVAYKTLVRPKQDYAAPIWSPINQIEKLKLEDSSPLYLQEMAKHE